MERVLFTDYPDYNFNEGAPMSEAPFYKWLTENISILEGLETLTYLELVSRYLKKYGFNIKKHYLGKDKFRNLKYITQYFWDNKNKLEKGTTMDKQVLIASIKAIVAEKGIIVLTNGGKKPLIPYIVGEGVGDFITKVTSNTVYIETIYQYGESVKNGRYEKLENLKVGKLQTILDYIK